MKNKTERSNQTKPPPTEINKNIKMITDLSAEGRIHVNVMEKWMALWDLVASLV